MPGQPRRHGLRVNGKARGVQRLLHLPEHEHIQDATTKNELCNDVALRRMVACPPTSVNRARISARTVMRRIAMIWETITRQTLSYSQKGSIYSCL